MRRAAMCLLLAVVLGSCAFNWIENLAAVRIRSSNAPVGDPRRGEELFRQGIGAAPPCITCHALARGGFSIGPPMEGVAARAATRIAGLSAETYLRQSILDPQAFTAPGFRPIMYPDYALHLTDQDVADLVAFLLAL